MLALSGAMRGRYFPALVTMLVLMLHHAPGTNAAPWKSRNQQPHDQAETESQTAEQFFKLPTAKSHGCVNRAADVARAAAKICGNLPIEEALRSVTLPAAAARRAGEALAALGFDTALDLQLLGGGDAAAELLAELKAGGLGAADRAKVRLLVGDGEHLWRLAASSVPSKPFGVDHDDDADDADGDDGAHDEADYGSRTAASSPGPGHPSHSSSEGNDDAAVAYSRRLQSSDADSGGMSADTIAIVLSVLVGAAGFVVQAHTARRAERAQEQQAMEVHAAEQARQREHQMMTAQIERTHKALDQCIRPVGNDIYTMVLSRMTMVQQIVSKMEVSHPDAVEDMLAFVTTYEHHPDGTVTSATSGKLVWTPNPPPELTRALAKPDMAAPSGAACLIYGHDGFVCISKPYCFEMPDAILATVAAEPTGEIAEMYRGYVRHTLMPLFRRVAKILQEFSAYVELPTKEWLEKTYPEMSWRSFTNAVFVIQLYDYTISFERILADWSHGNVKSVRPGCGQPIGAMLRTFVWSQEKAEAKQAELIGMTAVAEVDHTVFSRVEVSTSAFETEE